MRTAALAVLLSAFATTARAYSFSAYNIYYNITSEENRTVEVTYLHYNNSSNSSAYTGDVVIPSTVSYNNTTYTVTGIEEYAFAYCSILTSITSLNPEPPTCGSSCFKGVDTDTCILYVPEGSKSAYSTAIERKDFFNIEEIEVNGIDGVNADGQTEASGCYTFDGKRISTPQKGVNVIRYSDGTTKKVYVK